MSLLHALTVLLAVLLCAERLRRALSNVYLGKHRSLRQQGSCNKPVAAVGSSSQEPLAPLELSLTDPKYKRDPDIDVDSEKIGYDPML